MQWVRSDRTGYKPDMNIELKFRLETRQVLSSKLMKKFLGMVHQANQRASQ